MLSSPVITAEPAYQLGGLSADTCLPDGSGTARPAQVLSVSGFVFANGSAAMVRYEARQRAALQQHSVSSKYAYTTRIGAAASGGPLGPHPARDPV